MALSGVLPSDLVKYVLRAYASTWSDDKLDQVATQLLGELPDPRQIVLRLLAYGFTFTQLVLRIGDPPFQIENQLWCWLADVPTQYKRDHQSRVMAKRLVQSWLDGLYLS